MLTPWTRTLDFQMLEERLFAQVLARMLQRLQRVRKKRKTREETQRLAQRQQTRDFADHNFAFATAHAHERTRISTIDARLLNGRTCLSLADNQLRVSYCCSRRSRKTAANSMNIIWIGSE